MAAYNFIDVNEVSDGFMLPSEALQINGEYIENIVNGYRTLTVLGREALSPELSYYETGARDGSVLQNVRYPARTIVVTYQLITKTPEEFRQAYNKLASILNVQNAELIFNDEQDKYFIGTPSLIGEVEPGRTSVVGEIEFFCADPFKYSVEEYEATLDKTSKSIMVDYNGTHKSFPTLEADFIDEDELNGAITSMGDCGFVAFYNEREKIIQLGDAKEEDTESYPVSQTLVNQKFQKETAWDNAETKWETNTGRVSSDNMQKMGNVNMAVSAYLHTTAPSTSGTLLSTTSKMAKPYVDYKVTAKTSSRKADRIEVKVTITSTLRGSTSAGTITTTAGAKVTLNKTNIYTSSTAGSSSGTKSGTYYLWDSSVINGRIRVTNTKDNVGKSGQVSFWVKVSDIGVSSGFNKAFGLKGYIQFNNGEWNTVIIKTEGTTWKENSSHTATLEVTVKGIEADTDILEDIKFKVERTDDEDGNAGILDDTACKDLAISTYTAPVPDKWYLAPETFGTADGWHGPAISRILPADDAGDIGAVNCTLTYSQKMAIGKESIDTHQMGVFQALLISGSGSSRKVVAGVCIYKNNSGTKAKVHFYVNGKTVEELKIDLKYNNKYFGNNSGGNVAVKTSTITKSGTKIQFNVGGIKRTFYSIEIGKTPVTEITFYMGKYGTKPELHFNGLYWAKFVKDRCITWEDIPNKFSTNDVVTADCRSGEIKLNGTLKPELGALGNDWEEFYLTPGLNQIGFTYSDWVEKKYAPTPKIRYREVFL